MGDKNSNLLIAKHSSGKMIDISDAQNGLKCNCRCLCCGDRLVAKQGQINEWHFAHESGAECAGSLESALHKAAKQIILEEQLLYVDSHDPILAIKPNIYGLLNSTSKYLKLETPNLDKNSDTSIFYQFASRELVDKVIQTKSNCTNRKLTLTNVVSEVKAKNSTLVPDISCIFDGKPLYIEIVVTHECNETKTNQLKLLKVPTIEIHLSDLRNINFKMSDIREALIIKGFHPCANILREWIVKPRYIAEAEFYAKQFIDIATKRIDEIALEKAKKEAEKVARKTKIKAFGTTIVINKFNFGVSIWVPIMDIDDFNELNKLLLSLKAKRRETDWLLTVSNAKEVAIEAITKKDNERLDKISELARQDEAKKGSEYIKLKKKQELELENAIIEDAKRREEWRIQRELELKQQQIDRQNQIEEEKLRLERKIIADAKREQFIRETCDKYSHITDHRWRLKKINEDLQSEGYSKLSNVI